MKFQLVICSFVLLLNFCVISSGEEEISHSNSNATAESAQVNSNSVVNSTGIRTETGEEHEQQVKVKSFDKSHPLFDHTDLKRWDARSEKALINRQMGIIDGSRCQYSDFEKNFRLTTPEILRKDGHANVESHYVTTADGYIIEIHRIPNPGKPVVYALAGIFQSSRDLVINCKERSLAEKIYDAGYDTWLGNFRGNTYGKNHTTLSLKSREFWSFKTDDLIDYDAPAIVDYILRVTGQKQLNWIGFSLGNTVLFGLLSSRPEYNAKIHLGIAMGPAVFFGNTRSFTLNVMARNRGLLMAFVNNFWHGEVLPPYLTYLVNIFGPKLCIPDAKTDMQGICSRLLNFIDGKDPGQINYAVLPLMMGGFPSPTSISTVGQWFQWIVNGRFNRFDYGTRTKNFLAYSEESPPDYNLNNVKSPIVTINGANDLLTSSNDVIRLNEALPNLVGSITVNWKLFNHMDFLYARDADVLVYDYILNVLKISYTDAVKQEQSIF